MIDMIYMCLILLKNHRIPSLVVFLILPITLIVFEILLITLVVFKILLHLYNQIIDLQKHSIHEMRKCKSKTLKFNSFQ